MVGLRLRASGRGSKVRIGGFRGLVVEVLAAQFLVWLRFSDFWVKSLVHVFPMIYILI